MITRINESTTLSTHLSCECKCRSNGKNVIQINFGITINVNMSVKNDVYLKKDYIWNPSTCNSENGKYVANIMGDSGISCDEIIELLVKKATFKTQNFYILVTFLLIAVVLLIAVNIYFYLIKYQEKRKYLLPFYNTNNKLKQVL